MKSNLETNMNNEVIVDELTICYTACSSVLRSLKQTNIGGSYRHSNYRLIRLKNSRFRFYFNVLDASDVEVASLKFGLYTDVVATGETRAFLAVQNHILYDQERLEAILDLPASLGLAFHHFTALDLAVDSSFNASSYIKRCMRDKSLTTIINGKRVRDRDRVLPGVCFQYSSTLNRLKNPTVTIKQKKAIRSKRKGTVVQAYDKLAEIEHQSHKQYILDYYGRPKRLYRLEVRLGYQELQDYFNLQKVTVSPDIIFQQSVLQEMFFYHLASVIRFTRGRTQIRWEDVFKITPAVPINNSPCQCSRTRRKTRRRGCLWAIEDRVHNAVFTPFVEAGFRLFPRGPRPTNIIAHGRPKSRYGWRSSMARCSGRRE